MPEPSDHAVRQRLAEQQGITFFIKAGAGTGKTTTITRRIVALVASGWLDIRRLAAMTFTEAAAAELRSRVRDGLQHAAHGDAPGAAACRAALAVLEQASIGTIHGFALELLRTHPLEAGVPPHLRVLAGVEQDRRAAEAFRAWFTGLDAAAADGRAVATLLLLGSTPGQLRDTFAGLLTQEDMLRDAEWSVPAAPLSMAVCRRVGEDLRAAREYVRGCRSADDLLAVFIAELAFAEERLLSADDENAALAALQALPIKSLGRVGKQELWTSREAITEARAALTAVLDDADEHLAAVRGCALLGALQSMRAALLDAGAQRRREGVATFADLLVWARDLVRGHPAVRASLQARWDHLIVDEFQDTDPLQAELAILLCAQPGSDGPWRECALVPGKLMVVGDPKQSIYRFRRADIAIFDLVEQRVRVGGGETPHLQANFRSVTPIVDAVNAHFRDAMQAVPGVQAGYVDLHAHAGDGGTVAVTGGEAEAGARQSVVWQREADDVARCARLAVDQGWKVRDPAGGWRAARFADVCVLVPTRTNLRRLERAFEHYDVPYRLDTGTLIVATQEVRDVVSCMRAIDDPSDQVAIVAALRSPAYGCDDAELLRWHQQGGRWSYRGRGAGTEPRVAAAFDHMESFHAIRHGLRPAAVIERFLDERLLRAAALDDRRPRETWRRYRYLVDTAERLEAAGETTLRAFVDWMETLERDQERDAAAPAADDEDCIRVSTVHGSKGLEYPVVILTGTGSKVPHRAAAVIPDRREGTLHAKCGDAVTAGFEGAKALEATLNAAERQRLLYVAATRARDHLVVSLHRRAGIDCDAAALALTLERRDGVRHLDLTAVLERAPASSVRAALAEELVEPEAEQAWLKHRASRIAEHRRLQVTSATALAHAAPPARVAADPPDAVVLRGRGATALGRAVHAVLQVIDLAEPEAGLPGLAAAAATAEGVAEHAARVEALVRAVCATPVVQAAARGPHWREVPVAATLDGVVVEGFIDLLAEIDGELRVIDYKTDAVTADQAALRMEGYRIQAAVYAMLVEEATGRPVAGADFVFAVPAVVLSLPHLSAATAEVRARVAALPDALDADSAVAGAATEEAPA